MLCPTDSYNRQPFMGEQGTESHGFGDNWARGNYGANAALGPADYRQLWYPVWGNRDHRANAAARPRRDGRSVVCAA